mmetsp:Transcript_18007/g.44991  ORF Transcript_18007/g.44991 Transcript_18007/m.44991 type:complete len:926 (-) Transcript_18007:934-3711(-)|eukprot:CAMPEP_0178988174 /NCGR_PEP_ID=MMETSP0795-20121207/3672_1 /TAXON_ID=88552 /ORGANISM="Amoebophrya sp., Strain Ameob2" /LENGTH=925 /DNA_ID=CAMNT_0020679435 /DNA_START=403 /DNA_END=3180 /DNA_ORIENTATION=-
MDWFFEKLASFRETGGSSCRGRNRRVREISAIGGDHLPDTNVIPPRTVLPLSPAKAPQAVPCEYACKTCDGFDLEDCGSEAESAHTFASSSTGDVINSAGNGTPGSPRSPRAALGNASRHPHAANALRQPATTSSNPFYVRRSAIVSSPEAARSVGPTSSPHVGSQRTAARDVGRSAQDEFDSAFGDSQLACSPRIVHPLSEVGSPRALDNVSGVRDSSTAWGTSAGELAGGVQQRVVENNARPLHGTSTPTGPAVPPTTANANAGTASSARSSGGNTPLQHQANIDQFPHHNLNHTRTTPQRVYNPRPVTFVEVVEDNPAPTLGIVRIDHEYAPVAGNVAHPSSYAYRSVSLIVPGLTFQMCRKGQMSREVERAFYRVLDTLVFQFRVSGITSDCGFMLYFQAKARAHLKSRSISHVPVFMSAFAHLPAVICGLDADAEVAILTANGRDLMPMLDLCLSGSGGAAGDQEKAARGRASGPGGSSFSLSKMFLTPSRGGKASSPNGFHQGVATTSRDDRGRPWSPLGKDHDFDSDLSTQRRHGHVDSARGHGGTSSTPDSRFVVVSCTRIPGLQEALECGRPLDREEVAHGLAVLTEQVLEAHPRVAVFLLECTELPVYSDVIRRESGGMPVYDAITNADFFMSGALNNARFGSPMSEQVGGSCFYNSGGGGGGAAFSSAPGRVPGAATRKSSGESQESLTWPQGRVGGYGGGFESKYSLCAGDHAGPAFAAAPPPRRYQPASGPQPIMGPPPAQRYPPRNDFYGSYNGYPSSNLGRRSPAHYVGDIAEIEQGGRNSADCAGGRYPQAEQDYRGLTVSESMGMVDDGSLTRRTSDHLLRSLAGLASMGKLGGDFPLDASSTSTRDTNTNTMTPDHGISYGNYNSNAYYAPAPGGLGAVSYPGSCSPSRQSLEQVQFAVQGEETVEF